MESIRSKGSFGEKQSKTKQALHKCGSNKSKKDTEYQVFYHYQPGVHKNSLRGRKSFHTNRNIDISNDKSEQKSTEMMYQPKNELFQNNTAKSAIKASRERLRKGDSESKTNPAIQKRESIISKSDTTQGVDHTRRKMFLVPGPSAINKISLPNISHVKHILSFN